MSDQDMDPNEEDVLSTLVIKVPFLLLGVALGMLTVYVALKWVPQSLLAAQAALAS